VRFQLICSAILTILSTLPTYHTNPQTVRLLFGLDTTVVVLFTLEYLARTLAHSDSWSQYYRWSTSFFAILDFIAIFPYYIEVARNDDTSILFRFSILRTFRLLRVFRSFKYQNQMLLTIEVMYVAVQRSKDALVALSFFILLVLVFFATLIYFAERGSWDANLGGFVDADGDPSMFDSIPQTAWFALVTMSTVGYGDVVPRSFLGKLLTMPLLMFGLLLIALPSFVLGRNFAIVFDAMNNQALIAVSCRLLFDAELMYSRVRMTHPALPSIEIDLDLSRQTNNHIRAHLPLSCRQHPPRHPLIRHLGRTVTRLSQAQQQKLNLGCGMVHSTVLSIIRHRKILQISSWQRINW
jgi:voltage-gated potassium channel Kch